jgi:hypothetical protein
MKRVLVAGVATFLTITASHAGGYAAPAAGPVYAYPPLYAYPPAVRQPNGRAVRGVAWHRRCVVQNVCDTAYYAYGHWTGEPKTECVCR